MKTLMIASAISAALASAAVAADFEETGVSLVLERENLSFGIDTVDGEATALTFDVAVLPHTVLGADAQVKLGFEYGVVTEDFTFSAAYAMSKAYGQITVYGDAEAAYTVASGDTGGEWTATPTVGASYAVNDKLSAFGEVSYTWNVTDDWSREGGAVEVGAHYSLSDSVVLAPSLVHTFDTKNDATNFNMTVAVLF
jgi:opacity protein-like surface antigen